MADQAASYSGGAAAFVATIIADSGGVIHDTPNGLDTISNSGAYTLSASDFSTSTGQMDWWGAQAWVNYLNVIDYGGSNQWALPTTVDTSTATSCGASCGFPNGAAGNPSQSSSQLAELFYGGLGQVSGSSIATTHNSSYSLFSNVQSSFYVLVWYGVFRVSASAWSFGTQNSSFGFQSLDPKDAPFYALAVSPGNVSAVPLPSAVWLLGSGLLGLVGLRRRNAETLRLR